MGDRAVREKGVPEMRAERHHRLAAWLVPALLAATVPGFASHTEAATERMFLDKSLTPEQPQPQGALPDRVRVQRPADPRFNHQGAVDSATVTSATPVVGDTWLTKGPSPILHEASLSRASGRVTAVAVDPTNSGVIFIGAAGGGVWKTTNGGASWTPLTDRQATMAIGALAIDPSNHSVIYAGTGEDNESDSQPSQGILKSTNGGGSWTLLGRSTFAGHHIGGIAVDRTTTGTTQHVQAATDVGLFQSADGGVTWTRNTQILTVTDTPAGVMPSGGVTEVYQDPTTATTFWVSISDFCNTEFGDIARSTDGGVTWSIANNFASIPVAASRIGLGVGAGGVAYLAFAGCDGNAVDLQKTTNGGASWSSIASGTGLFNYFNEGAGGQGWYDNVVRVDPLNTAHAVFGGVTALATGDGGASFTDIGKVYQGGVVHPDQHAIFFTALNTFYLGGDGGIWKTSDLGGTGASTDWSNLNSNLSITQFYAGVAPTRARFLGGTQDNGSVGNLPGAAALPAGQQYLGGDGGYTAVDPTSGSTTVYAEFPFLHIEKGSSTLGAPGLPFSSFRPASPCDFMITPPPSTGPCAEPSGFVTPFVMDPANAQRLVTGTNRIYQTMTGGTPAGLVAAGGAWSAISPDVTTGTTFTSHGDWISRIVMGGTGATNTIFTGSTFGAVFMSTDGVNWRQITGNLPKPTQSTFLFPQSWIGGIAFNPSNVAEAWVTLGGVGVPHVWHTVNAGAPGNATTWSSIDGTGPTGVPNAPVPTMLDGTSNTLYIGTAFGTMVCTTCSGATPTPSWSILGTKLPHVLVDSLSLTRDGSHLFAWTHGRGGFTLELLPASASLSTVTANPTSVTADGIATSTITVTLKDSTGNPVDGATVALSQLSGPGTPTISPASGVSNTSGIVKFTVRSTTPGTDQFQASDVSDGVTITQTASVTFT